jgi:CHAT domain-containing protein
MSVAEAQMTLITRKDPNVNSAPGHTSVWRRIAPLLLSAMLSISLSAHSQDARDQDAALAAAEAAVRVSEQQRGPDDPETATRINLLAMLYRDDGQYPKALLLLERALAIREKLLGINDPATAEILNNMARVYLDTTEYAKGLALSERALAAREKMLGADHPDTATSVFTTARLYREMGEYTKVPPLLERSLAIREKALGPEHPDTAQSLNELAWAFRDQGQYAQSKAMFKRALAIREKALGPEDATTADSLSDLADVYRYTSDYANAIPLSERALAIREKVYGPDHPATADSLNNLARVEQAMGRYVEATPLFERALAIREKSLGPNHMATADSLNDLAELYREMGQYAKALPLYESCLVATEKAVGPFHGDVAATLNNMALAYRELGEYGKALPLVERSLMIQEKVNGPDHPATATTVNSLAALSRELGRYDDAVRLGKRALAIREKALGSDNRSTAVSLNNLALTYRSMGQYAKALPLFERGLAINEKALGPDHAATATTLSDLALLYSDMGKPAKALPLAIRASRSATAAGLPGVSFNVQSMLAKYYVQQKMTQVGVFYGKQAVNTMQQLRQGNRGLERELQRSLLQKNQKIYQQLADWLIIAGRLAEAQQVLAMLKQDEYFEFIQRDAADDTPTLATYTGREPEWARRYEEISGQLAALGKELGGLRAIKSKGGLDPEQEKRLSQLEQDMATASQAFDAMVATMVQDLGSMQAQDTTREKIDTFSALREVLGEMGEGVVLLHYVPLPERMHIILTTRDVQLAREVNIGEESLNQKIAKLREVLQDRRRDPRPLAQELYGLLLKPVAADLEQVGAKMVMLSLNGSLRYLPFAALYDGKRYVVERYALALYTDAAAANLKERAPVQVRVWGLGLTQARPGFNALPNVKEELEGIIGAVPGQAYMDEAFTAAKLHEGLERAYPVLHIASHFRFTPGTEQDSYLVLGDGSHLTLAQVRHEYRFSGVDLLTLSACDSGFGGGRASDGREVEGLGALAQKRGAHGVLAALWPVADQSTAVLMPEMYRLRQEDKLSKAEALRQAQVEFIHGRAATDKPGSRRAAPRALAQPETPFAHPYFWAPFILMGNWL